MRCESNLIEVSINYCLIPLFHSTNQYAALSQNIHWPTSALMCGSLLVPVQVCYMFQTHNFAPACHLAPCVSQPMLMPCLLKRNPLPDRCLTAPLLVGCSCLIYFIHCSLNTGKYKTTMNSLLALTCMLDVQAFCLATSQAPLPNHLLSPL